MNPALARFSLAAVRAFIRRFPDARGVSRLRKFIEQHVLSSLPPDMRVTVTTADGRRFEENVHEPWFFMLMMMSRRDPAETALLSKLIDGGDTVIDIGANYGWYATWLARLVGPTGQVHAFEPTPTTMALLRRNCAENHFDDRIVFNPVGLSNAPGKATIHVPRQHGGASLKPHYDEPTTLFEITLTTLDDYISRNAIGKVRLIKIDVEGCELAVIQGAGKLLSTPHPPMWLMEVSRLTSKAFGYTSEELLESLMRYGYHICRILESPRGKLAKLEDPKSCDVVENVLCYHESDRGRVAGLIVG
ncbi:MAG: FkbM family methyltransferase [Phycisphaerae bacterium]|nr:FkbM family methyltransferase [Phycisphaerae bacterium]